MGTQVGQIIQLFDNQSYYLGLPVILILINIMSHNALSVEQRRNFIKYLFAAPLIAEANVIRSQNMVNTNKHFISFVEYWGNLGPGIGVVEESPEGGPYVSHQGGPQIVGSQPVPVQHQGQIQIAYLIYTYLNFPPPRRVFPL